MYKTISFVMVLLCLCTTTILDSQSSPLYRKYSTQDNSKRLSATIPSYNFDMQRVDRILDKVTPNTQFDGSIQIIFHVLYEDYNTRILPTEIENQIDLINQAFMNANYYPGNLRYNELRAYDNLSTNPDIMFCLADETQLNRINAINYKQSVNQEWELDDAMKFLTNSGFDVYEPNNYLNVWICPLLNSAGYAQYPGGPENTDGIVIDPKFFDLGRDGGEVLYDSGKTLVHLIANYLGLKDIWNESVECGDDLMSDTPIHNAPNYTLGGFYFNRSTCDDGFEMVMNYMDNSPDHILYMFTPEQAERMRKVISDNSIRDQLVSNTFLCEQGSENREIADNIPNNSTSSDIIIHPNPSENIFNVDLRGYNQDVTEIQIINISGQLVQKIPLNDQRLISIDLTESPDGIYLLQLSNETAIIKSERLVKTSK